MTNSHNSEPDRDPRISDSSTVDFRELVEESSSIIATTDSNEKISYVNAAAERILGYPSTDMIGNEWRTYVHHADEDTVSNVIAALRDGRMAKKTLELRCQQSDGEWCWLEATIRNRSDDTKGVIINGRDISDQKEREAERQTTRERMEMALKGANLGVWDWDMETGEVIRDELLTEMLGYTPSEMGDHLDDWHEVVHPDGQQRHQEALTDHIENGTPYYQCEYRLRTKSGELKWVRTVGKVVERDETGAPIRAVGIHQDIDDRKRFELALEAERDMFREGPAVVFKWADENGWPIVYASENAENVFGYTAHELQSADFVYADLVHDR